LNRRRIVAVALFAALGVILVRDSINTWNYTRSVNMGIVVSAFSGVFLVTAALKMALTDRPIIKSRQIRTVIRWIIIACLVLFIVAEGLIIADPYLHRAELAGNVDWLLVLGCRIWPDGSPTLALANRLDKAAEYYSEHPHVKIIVSGGQGADEPIPEAESMAEYLVKRGIPEVSIITEPRSTSTMENFRFSRDLLPPDLEEPVKLVFVTSDFHVLRARILAKRNGFEAYAIPAPTPSVILINSYLREFFAFIKSMLVDY